MNNLINDNSFDLTKEDMDYVYKSICNKIQEIYK